MKKLKQLSRVFKSSEEIPFDDSSKIIFMSDCHRGDGSWADDFLKNQNLYAAALDYYYQKNYTYIEIGDGDELWKNRSVGDIMQIHSDAFWRIQKFYEDERFYMLYGNHDMIKKSKRFIKKNFYFYKYKDNESQKALLKDIRVHEGLILKHRYTNRKIFVVHGHQGSFINDRAWVLGRFLVRYLWKPLELFGVNDPTSAAKNYDQKEAVGENLLKWSQKEKQMIIAGHTHKPVFPKVGEPLYFNDGSCVHPRCITGIEIVDGYIMLIKWCIKADLSGILHVGKETLAGPTKLEEYFVNNN